MPMYTVTLMQKYKVLYNHAIVTCMNLTLEITSTFLHETAKVLQIQIS